MSPLSLQNRLSRWAEQEYARTLPVRRKDTVPEAIKRFQTLDARGHRVSDVPNEVFSSVQTTLESLGYPAVSMFRKGGSSLVFRLLDAHGNDTGSILRLALQDSEEVGVGVPLSVLRSERHSLTAGGEDIILEIAPRVPLLADAIEKDILTQDEAEQVVQSLRRQVIREGGYPYDLDDPKNIGLLKDGTPVVIDKDAVFSAEQMAEDAFHESFRERENEKGILERKTLPEFSWADDSGAAKQDTLHQPMSSRPPRART